MFDKINPIIQKLSLDMWLYVCVGVIALVFILGLIFSVGSGSLKKFKKVAKKSLKNPSLANVTELATDLPIKTRKLFERAQAGERPSDVLGEDAVVLTPFSTSFASKFTKIILVISIFMTAFIYAVASMLPADGANTLNKFTCVLIVLVVGLLLLLLAGLVSTGVRAGAVRVFTKYVDMLDDVLVGAENKDSEEDKQTAVVANDVVEDKKTADILNAEEQTKAAAIATQENAALEEEKARAIKEEQKRLAAQNALAQAARAAAINAAPQAEPKPTLVSVSNSADEVIARIDRISRDGAPFSAMKEVALALQQERAKPENKTPEQARKLNDALTLLLKAMSSATRR